MDERQKFDEAKALYAKNPIWIYGLIDKYTVNVAKLFYNLGFSANLMTLMTFIIGLSSLGVLFFMRTYTGLVIASILIFLRNIGDTADGKIARGSNTASPKGGFYDIITDWIIFHAAFFILLGFLTDNIAIGFLCVTGYMSREFTRRRFEKAHGKKAKETEESKKISGLVSIITKYDIATVTFFAPIFLLLNQLEFLIYFVAITEYTLLFGELVFDLICLNRKKPKELEKSERIV